LITTVECPEAQLHAIEGLTRFIVVEIYTFLSVVLYCSHGFSGLFPASSASQTYIALICEAQNHLVRFVMDLLCIFCTTSYRAYTTQTPIVRFVVDLLFNLLYTFIHQNGSINNKNKEK
jgi:hypothetical protein